MDSAAAEVVAMVGRNIRIVRTLRDMRQGELAARAGVSREYICSLETGSSAGSPRLSTLVAIARALGVHFHRLCYPIEVDGLDVLR